MDEKLNTPIPNYDKTDVKQTPKEVKAIITSIDLLTAKEMYGDDVKNPTQEIFRLKLENAEHNISINETIPKYEKGEVPDGSKLGKYINKYSFFAVGEKVLLTKDPKNNFWKISM